MKEDFEVHSNMHSDFDFHFSYFFLMSRKLGQNVIFPENFSNTKKSKNFKADGKGLIMSRKAFSIF